MKSSQLSNCVPSAKPKSSLSDPIILRIDNIFTDIVGDLSTIHCKKIQRKLSFRPKDVQWSAQYNRFWTDKDGRKKRVWDGWKRQFWKNKKRTYFPTGLLSLVREYFDEEQVPYRCTSLRQKPETNIDLNQSEVYTLRDYQKKVVNDSCERTRGIIQAATGSGKTVIAGGIIKELKVCPFIFFVTSIDLLTQAREELQKMLLLDNKNITVGQIGGGVVDIHDVNVMTVQTAVRALGKKWDKSHKFDSDDEDKEPTPIERHRDDIQDLIRSAKGSICDEVQHWRADTCQLVSRELKSVYYTYGMSATPYRDEGDDLMIQACFGKKIAQITASQLIREGYLVRPDIKMIHMKGPKSPFKSWPSLYKDQVTENDTYNTAIANIANAYIEHDRLVLILVQQLNHGKLLQKMIDGSIFLSGKSPKKQREEGIRNLRNKYISAIVSTTIFDEGIDIKPLDTVILAGQGKSRTRAMQRIGRITRTFEGKEKATAIDFCIHQKFLKNHAREREKMYRTEPEYSIEDIGTEFD